MKASNVALAITAVVLFILGFSYKKELEDYKKENTRLRWDIAAREGRIKVLENTLRSTQQSNTKANPDCSTWQNVAERWQQMSDTWKETAFPYEKLSNGYKAAFDRSQQIFHRLKRNSIIVPEEYKDENGRWVYDESAREWHFYPKNYNSKFGVGEDPKKVWVDPPINPERGFDTSKPVLFKSKP